MNIFPLFYRHLLHRSVIPFMEPRRKIDGFQLTPLPLNKLGQRQASVITLAKRIDQLSLSAIDPSPYSRQDRLYVRNVRTRERIVVSLNLTLRKSLCQLLELVLLL